MLYGTKLRKVFGHGGIAIEHTINLSDLADPTNFQIRISGAELQSSIGALSSALSDVGDGLASKQGSLSADNPLPSAFVDGLVP